MYYESPRWIKLLWWWIFCSGEDWLRGREVTACVRASHGCQDTATTSVSLCLSRLTCSIVYYSPLDSDIFPPCCLPLLDIIAPSPPQISNRSPHGLPLSCIYIHTSTLHYNPVVTHTRSVGFICDANRIWFYILVPISYQVFIVRGCRGETFYPADADMWRTIWFAWHSLISYITRILLKFSLLWSTHSRTEAPRGFGEWPKGSRHGDKILFYLLDELWEFISVLISLGWFTILYTVYAVLFKPTLI